jgi:uncharacterized damage-inducible protein DinB
MTAATDILGEVGVFRSSARITQQVLHMNVQDLTQEESLIQPQPGGNCVNWVVGHVLTVYNEVLPLVGQKPVMDREELKRYKRGAEPLKDGSEALPLSGLLAALDQAVERVDKGMASLSPEQLDAKAPMSPRNDPNETVRSLLALVSFHQAYHAGQLGLLRRIVGKKGAIA